jgi:hypothetical protein
MKYIFKMFIFFACPKKMNQQRSGERKDSRSLGPTKRDFPALLKSAGSLKTREVYAPLRGAQTVQTPISADSVLLGLREMA